MVTCRGVVLLLAGDIRILVLSYLEKFNEAGWRKTAEAMVLLLHTTQLVFGYANTANKYHATGGMHPSCSASHNKIIIVVWVEWNKTQRLTKARNTETKTEYVHPHVLLAQ